MLVAALVLSIMLPAAMALNADGNSATANVPVAEALTETQEGVQPMKLVPVASQYSWVRGTGYWNTAGGVGAGPYMPPIIITSGAPTAFLGYWCGCAAANVQSQYAVAGDSIGTAGRIRLRTHTCRGEHANQWITWSAGAFPASSPAAFWMSATATVPGGTDGTGDAISRTVVAYRAGVVNTATPAPTVAVTEEGLQVSVAKPGAVPASWIAQFRIGGTGEWVSEDLLTNDFVGVTDGYQAVQVFARWAAPYNVQVFTQTSPSANVTVNNPVGDESTVWPSQFVRLIQSYNAASWRDLANPAAQTAGVGTINPAPHTSGSYMSWLGVRCSCAAAPVTEIVPYGDVVSASMQIRLMRHTCPEVECQNEWVTWASGFTDIVLTYPAWARATPSIPVADGEYAYRTIVVYRPGTIRREINPGYLRFVTVNGVVVGAVVVPPRPMEVPSDWIFQYRVGRYGEWVTEGYFPTDADVYTRWAAPDNVQVFVMAREGEDTLRPPPPVTDRVTFVFYGTDVPNVEVPVEVGEPLSAVALAEVLAAQYNYYEGWAVWGWFTAEALNTSGRVRGTLCGEPDCECVLRRRPVVGADGFDLDAAITADMLDATGNKYLYAIWALWGDLNDDDNVTLLDLDIMRAYLRFAPNVEMVRQAAYVTRSTSIGLLDLDLLRAYLRFAPGVYLGRPQVVTP